MKNWTIRKRIIFGFASLLTLVAALAAVSLMLSQQLKRDSEIMNHDALPGVNAMSEIQSDVAEIQINVLQALHARSLENREKFQNEISQRRQEILNVMNEYKKTLVEPGEIQLWADLEKARDAYIGAREEVFALLKADKKDEALDLNASKLRPAYSTYQEVVDKLFDYNRDIAANLARQSEAAATRANFITLGLSLGVIVLGIGFAVTIITSLNRALSRVSDSLDEGAQQISSAAGQVSSSSQVLAEGASEQAASIEETSSSLEEMASMTKRNSENAQKASELARQTRAAADRGATDMQSMTSAMEAIKVSSDDIAKIIKTIDEIAFQTNILALNAAVEAARAGEAGMGFAVVADEVRNLAQRSAQAAKETAAKIESAIVKTGQGVEISGKVLEALNDIVVKVRQVDELVAEVAGASREQTQGITQINTAVGQMDKVTQSNAANAEESAAAAEELSAQAAIMKQSVGELLRLVGGEKGVNSSSAREPVVAPEKTFGSIPAVKAPRRTRQNGNETDSAALAVSANGHGRKSEIPLGEFENF